MNFYNFHVRIQTAVEKAINEQLALVHDDELVDMCNFINNRISLNNDYDKTTEYLKSEKVKRGLK
jgi:hypothetical protein